MAGNSTSGRKPKQSLGFLTVLECPRDGLFGGYLVLNSLARPLEFHCTAPIRPNRAQQILYGPTLDAYLFGEQIGHSLIKGASHTPLAVFTDHPAVMAVRDLVELPLALVEHPPSGTNVEHPPSGVANACPQPAAAMLHDSSQPGAAMLQADAGAKTWRIHSAHAADSALRHFHWGQNRLSLAASGRAQGDETAILERLAEVADSFDLSEPFVRIREAIAEARTSGGD